MSEEEVVNIEEKTESSSISKPLLRLKLLDSLRQGEFSKLNQLIQSADFQPLNNPAVQEVVQLTLHYAVQVAPFVLIRDIVSNWCNKPSSSKSDSQLVELDINKQDSDGNSSLHLAALQSRGDVVQLLMNHRKINDCIINNAHLQPIEMCKNLNIAQLMQVSRANYVAEIAHEFRLAFDNRDFAHLESILSNPRNSELLDINGNDPETGDTVLHEFVKKRDVMMCRWILDHGGDPFKRDKRGRLPVNSLGKVPVEKDATSSEHTKTAVETEIKLLLDKAAREQSVIDVTNNLHEPPSYKGYLRKWTNFAQGYKLRWFILSSDGTLSYYKDQEDTGNACRGSLNMSTCYLHLDSSEKLKFEIIGGSNGTVRWHLKGNHPIETNKWVWAIQSAIRTAKDREIIVRGTSHSAALEQQQQQQHPLPALSPPPPPGAQQQTPQPPQQLNGSNIPISKMLATASATTLTLNSKISSDNFKSLQNYDQRRHIQEQASRLRSDSGSSSPSSSDLELNDNLTHSGRQYVAKVKHNKNCSRSVSGSSSLTHSGNESYHGSQKLTHESVLMEDPTLSHGNLGNMPSSLVLRAEEDYEEEEEEPEDLLVNGKPQSAIYEEEDVKMTYGPFSQELSMLQRSIVIEITTLNELLDDGHASESVLDTAKKSLSTINKNFSQLHKLTEKRDQRLVKMLSKQKDINNLWIRSVKELEIELIEKSEKLASMDKDRRNLKKLLQKKLNEATIASEGMSQADGASTAETVNARASTKQFAEIVEFIQSNQSSDDDDSDIDEFFDAEDLGEDDDYNNHDGNSNHYHAHAQDENLHGAAGEKKGAKAENVSSSRVEDTSVKNDSAQKLLPMVSNNAAASITTTTNAAHVVLKEPGLELEQAVELADQNFRDLGLHSTACSTITDAMDAAAVANTVSGFAPGDIIIGDSTTDVVSAPLAEAKCWQNVALTAAQKAKMEMLLAEGTYLGYEEEVRKKLALNKDERPKINLWSALKSMIGKDMTRMSLPVTFNEPTSLLQRVAEDLEYSDILDTACSFDDSTLRLLHVAAFISSSYASTTNRVAKPFNPLLGETFEYARPDKNYRFFTEQVSHHPPISATWTESPKWDFWGESHVDSKFYGRSFDVKHLGLWYLALRPDDGSREDLYTWKKPENSVIGILIGKPEIDNHGDVTITNHTTGDYCLLHFKARGWRSANAFEVRGEVYNSSGIKKWVLGGHWNESIYGKAVLIPSSSEELTLDKSKPHHRAKQTSTVVGPNYDGNKFLLWHTNERPNSPFNLTSFAITLNALQPKLLLWLAPTDTRLRPDQRAMEDGRYSDAADEKRRLEEKQRATRRVREAENAAYSPKWFKKVRHPVTGQDYWEYTGQYWKLRKEQKLQASGNIF
ncbi:uncharacterized protein Ecym_5249 [Eremothecium cymbalariae DBVPG|uniref:PH domain-containing protein n=1 Tax=Eremothecium cymbalariae (strain CBS 270.75 / DBVPG 7215 / KCTC 17166 / NRRL Y-17582) TaxID=931890 RepID=I6ND73_ERECY|nr:hypothetical protein Ecym_5249 [Eremothecium cymbalariae DBVPG\